MQETKIWRRRLHVISHRVSAFLTSLWEILITSCFTAVTIILFIVGIRREKWIFFVFLYQ